MIWGLTRDQKRYKKWESVHEAYAIFPIRLEDDRWIWLQKYYYINSYALFKEYFLTKDEAQAHLNWRLGVKENPVPPPVKK